MNLPKKFNDTVLFTSANLREIFQVSDITLWRWKKKGLLGSPSKITGRNYWTRQAVISLCNKFEETNTTPDTAA